jgi:competence protein ComEA
MRTSNRSRGLAAAAALALLCAGPVWAQSTARTGAAKPQLVGTVNINTATPDQLELLPGVGPERARAIVEWRGEHGAFKSVDDLLQVSGIGQKALDRMRPHVTVSGKSDAEMKPGAAKP